MTRKELLKLKDAEVIEEAKKLGIEVEEKAKKKDVINLIVAKQEEMENGEPQDPKTSAADMKASNNVTEKTESVDTKIDNQQVVLTRSIKCFIGADYYNFKSNVKYKVSEHVKRVLIDRGVVKPTY